MRQESGVVVTNFGSLRRRYGEDMDRIEAAMYEFVDSRRAQGIELQVLALDDQTQLRPFAVTPVADPSDLSGNKRAIDTICQLLDPEYLLIVGSVDIVPHQHIATPFPDSIETHVATDWTYGWRGRDSLDPARIPRMVGRIPGITGCRSAEPLIAALANASKIHNRRISDYFNPFVVCSTSFFESTRQIVGDVFEDLPEICAVPSLSGTGWNDAQIGRLLHLINCHGAPQTPFFSGRGERGPTYPALLAEQLEGRLSEGTIAAVTCCYGAYLYAPMGDGERARYSPMCNAFLRNGAIGYFGSTGPSDGGQWELKEADRLVRDFVRMLFRGASLGEAARYAVVELASSPTGLDAARARKNAWQFVLLGDPTARLQAIEAGIEHSGNAAHYA